MRLSFLFIIMSQTNVNAKERVARLQRTSDSDTCVFVVKFPSFTNRAGESETVFGGRKNNCKSTKFVWSNVNFTSGYKIPLNAKAQYHSNNIIALHTHNDAHTLVSFHSFRLTCRGIFLQFSWKFFHIKLLTLNTTTYTQTFSKLATYTKMKKFTYVFEFLVYLYQ